MAESLERIGVVTTSGGENAHHADAGTSSSSVGCSRTTSSREWSKVILDHCGLDGVLLELTHACNLNCVHCYQYKKVEPQMDFDFWRNVVDDTVEQGCFSIGISGGEPTMVGYWQELVEYCLNADCTVEIKTNGLLLTEDKLERLTDKPNLSISVSIAGSKADLHDRVTGVPGSFDATLTSLRLLSQMGIKTRCCMVIHQMTFDDRHAAEKMCRDLGFELRKEMQLSEPFHSNPSASHLRLTDDQMTSYWEEELNDGLLRIPKGRMGMCCAGTLSCAVGPTGEVFPCVCLRIPLGNLADKRFSDIWRNSPALCKLRKVGWADFDCSRCEDAKNCDPCPGEAFVTKKDMFAVPEEYCRATKIKCRLGGRD